MLGLQLITPRLKKRLKLWVNVRGKNHWGPFPIGLACLVVSRAMPDDPTALPILEQSLPYLKLPYGALPASQ